MPANEIEYGPQYRTNLLQALGTETMPKILEECISGDARFTLYQLPDRRIARATRTQLGVILTFWTDWKTYYREYLATPWRDPETNRMVYPK